MGAQIPTIKIIPWNLDFITMETSGYINIIHVNEDYNTLVHCYISNIYKNELRQADILIGKKYKGT